MGLMQRGKSTRKVIQTPSRKTTGHKPQKVEDKPVPPRGGMMAATPAFIRKVKK